MSSSNTKNVSKLTEKQKKDNKKFLKKLDKLKHDAVDNCKKYLEENSNNLKNYKGLRELINKFDKTFSNIIDYYNNDENNFLFVDEKIQKNKTMKTGRSKSKSKSKSKSRSKSKSKSMKLKKGGSMITMNNYEQSRSNLRQVIKINKQDLLALLFFWLGLLYICLVYQETIDFIDRVNSYRINNSNSTNSGYDFLSDVITDSRRSAGCNENGCTSCVQQMMYYAYFSLLYMKAFINISSVQITDEIVRTLKVEGVVLINMGIKDFIDRAQIECGTSNSIGSIAFEMVNTFVMGDTTTSECLTRTQNNLWKKHLNRLDDIRSSVSNMVISRSTSIVKKLRISCGLLFPSVSYFLYRINGIRIAYHNERENENQLLQLQEMGPHLRYPNSLVSHSYNSNNENGNGQLIIR